MGLFKEILDIQDSKSLSIFLEVNFNSINDLLNFSNNELKLEKQYIEEFILLKRNIIENLDFDINAHKIFVIYLFDFCVRLNLIAASQIIYSILEGSNIRISSRLEAAKIYLLEVNFNDEYISNFERICEKLEFALANEEDNEQIVIETFFHFYLKVFKDTSPVFSNQLFEKLKLHLGNNQYQFLNNNFIVDLSNLDYLKSSNIIDDINELLDKIQVFFNAKSYEDLGELLIEIETDYSNLLELVEAKFSSIKQISVNQYNLIADNSIFYSLQRGVKILDDEKQLFAYMYSFGNMHYHKLQSAFKFLPENFFENSINVIDWGCGQAMATMTYLDFINQNSINQSCQNIILIEPSEIALKRGVLHVKKYLPGAKISTIKKDLDSLNSNDFKTANDNVNLHLFSNILDIDLFSLTHLTKLIEENFKGENYFVCVSPYVTDSKTFRLDSFTNYFSKLTNFEIIKSINNRTNEWINGWARVIRVFKVDI